MITPARLPLQLVYSKSKASAKPQVVFTDLFLLVGKLLCTAIDGVLCGLSEV